MKRRTNKAMDDFLKGTFTSGGIFEEPAKIKFKPRPQPKEGPSLEDLIRRQAAGHQQRTEVNKAIQGDLKKQEKIKKLEALIADPGASEGEKTTARAIIKKLRG